MIFPENIFSLTPHYPKPIIKQICAGKIETYKCPECGRMCGSRGSYGVHLQKVHGISRLRRIIEKKGGGERG